MKALAAMIVQQKFFYFFFVLWIKIPERLYSLVLMKCQDSTTRTLSSFSQGLFWQDSRVDYIRDNLCIIRFQTNRIVDNEKTHNILSVQSHKPSFDTNMKESEHPIHSMYHLVQWWSLLDHGFERSFFRDIIFQLNILCYTQCLQIPFNPINEPCITGGCFLFYFL